MGKGKAAKLDRLVRASHPVEAHGQTFQFTPLSLAEIAKVESWARRQPFVRLAGKIEELCASNMPSEVRDRLIDRLTEEAQKASETQDGITAAMQTIEGIRFAILCGFQVRHPNMTTDTLDAIVSEVGLDFLKDLMESTSFVSEEEAGN